MGGLIRRTSISLPEDILKEGQRLAMGRLRNFSNYVADLIAADAEREASANFFGKSDAALDTDDDDDSDDCDEVRKISS